MGFLICFPAMSDRVIGLPVAVSVQLTLPTRPCQGDEGGERPRVIPHASLVPPQPPHPSGFKIYN